MEGEVLFGQYGVKAVLSENDHCRVYLAEVVTTGSAVAIKTPVSTEPYYLDTFTRIASAQLRLKHPSIVNTQAFLTSKRGVPFLVMDFIDGINLRELVSLIGRITEEEAADLLLQLCGALEHAHQLNIIHGCLMPEHILVTTRGNDVKLHIVSFGLGLMDPDENNFYMSPEFLEEPAPTKKMDLYSVGVLAFEFLAGRMPNFAKEETLKTAMPDVLCVDELSQVLMECMDPDPEWRLESVGELRSSLETWKQNVIRMRAEEKLVSDETEAHQANCDQPNQGRRLSVEQERLAQTVDKLTLLKRAQSKEEPLLARITSAVPGVSGPRQSPAKAIGRIALSLGVTLLLVGCVSFYAYRNIEDIGAAFKSASVHVSSQLTMEPDEDEAILEIPVSESPPAKSPNAGKKKLSHRSTTRRVRKFKYEESPQYSEWAAESKQIKPPRKIILKRIP